MMGEAAQNVGTAAFYPCVLRLVSSLVPSQRQVVMRYPRYGAPEMIRDDEKNPVRAYDLYLAGYYRFDPIYQHWCEGRGYGVLSYGEAEQESIASKDYFNTYLPKASIADDLGILLPGAGGAATVLALERTNGRFSSSEIALLRRVYPVVFGLHKAHLSHLFLRLTGIDNEAAPQETPRTLIVVDRYDKRVFASKAWRESAIGQRRLERARKRLDYEKLPKVNITSDLILHVVPLDADSVIAPKGRIYVLETEGRGAGHLDYDNAVARFLPSELTRRERDIVRLILAGYPTKLIADSLSLAEGTVRNHRQRLYYKMDITTERELFTAFLEFLSSEAN